MHKTESATDTNEMAVMLEMWVQPDDAAVAEAIPSFLLEQCLESVSVACVCVCLSVPVYDRRTKELVLLGFRGKHMSPFFSPSFFSSSLLLLRTVTSGCYC